MTEILLATIRLAMLIALVFYVPFHLLFITLGIIFLYMRIIK